MAQPKFPAAQNPLLLRFYRLVDAFAKSDDERDFYLDKIEGFIVYMDLDKGQKELEELEQELTAGQDRYCLLPKMTFYETKKFMEGFVNEKVYDIDTKEKLLDLIQSKEARENFLEFIYDHLTELEKWQQYYAERMRIRIIEWLRSQQIHFVFEEDVELPRIVVEKVKRHLFDTKVGKDVMQARDVLIAKSKTYYSSEALNPRPKRGRPPKQQVKIEVEPQLTGDMYTTVPAACQMFLFLPQGNALTSTFSAKEGEGRKLLGSSHIKVNAQLEELSNRLSALQTLSTRLSERELQKVIGEKESKVIKAMSAQAIVEPEVPETGEKKRGLLDVVKGFLPGRKKEKPTEQVAPEPSNVKKVTQIHKKKK